MKILAVMGSGRKKGNTFLSVKRLECKVRQIDSRIQFEYLYLSDAVISPCLGCRACFDRGEAHCPHKDSVLDIAQKMLDSDGVVFATPTYVCSMSGMMKNLLDRLAYFCHRPAFHGKIALVITTTGSAASNMAAKNVRLPLGSMGFTVAGSAGIALHTGDIVPVPEKAARKLDHLAELFYRRLSSDRRNAATIYGLVSFYMNRRRFSRRDTGTYDYLHFQQKGWLEPKCAYYTAARPSVRQVLVARAILGFLRST